MNSLLAFYSSSIGKKVIMSLTGLFLILFLVEHLLGNLFLLKSDGGAFYDAYSEFMASNPLVRAIEILLFASLFGHAISGAYVWWQNKRARPEDYEVYKLKENTPLESRITMLTGSLILLFLIVHLNTFFVPMRLSGEHVSGYRLVQEAFSSAYYSGFYIVALVLLGYHLKHGFQSAFQSLGLRGSKYDGLLDVIAFLIWFLLPLGFAILPVYFYFFNPVTPSAVMMGVY
jgi:succinate dehydrogenase / fumarate reductase cytochrome b subunit